MEDDAAVRRYAKFLAALLTREIKSLSTSTDEEHKGIPGRDAEENTEPDQLSGSEPNIRRKQ